MDFSPLEKILQYSPIQLHFLKKRVRSELVIDPQTFESGETKIVKKWSWKRLKYEKFAVTRIEGGKVNIQKVM